MEQQLKEPDPELSNQASRVERHLEAYCPRDTLEAAEEEPVTIEPEAEIRRSVTCQPDCHYQKKIRHIYDTEFHDIPPPGDVCSVEDLKALSTAENSILNPDSHFEMLPPPRRSHPADLHETYTMNGVGYPV
ncbi:hypothetical protein FGIG_06857 [Fasciola gigantica]|uniref:Uncharacterized protein n=1 Tax=Fasciola gigantica TaxID=46835 RepID=A0A504YKM7_FASGI|nr:hypothetical protein FGIG_06857 [Fasciola gigantica]